MSTGQNSQKAFEALAL